MGVASAAIAFAFHETADRTLAWSLAPVLVAVIFWGASFACAVLRSRESAMVIKANLKMNRGGQEGAEGKTLFEAANVKVSRYYDAQQWLILLGAIAYLIGHIWSLAEAAA